MSVRSWIHRFNRSNRFSSDINGLTELVTIDTSTAASTFKSFNQNTNNVDRLRTICEIQNILDQLQWNNTINELIDNIPQLVVLGSQSVGKTTILEHIIGHEDVLPKGNGMITRQPVIFRLYYDKNVDFFAVISDVSVPPSLEELNKIESVDPNYVIARTPQSLSQIILSKLKTTNWLVTTPLWVKVYSNKSPNLSLVDLPGLIRIPEDHQPADLDEQISKLILSYIEQPNSVIIAVSPANQDIANSDSLKLARKVDPEGKRTIGVLSKYDLAGEDEVIQKVLNGEIYKLYYGYVPVITNRQFPEESAKSISKLVSQLECIMFSLMSSKVISMHQKLQERLDAISKELADLNYLDSVINSAISNSKDSQCSSFNRRKNITNSLDYNESTTLYSFVCALNSFINTFEDVLSGQALFSDEELVGGSLLIELFNGSFAEEICKIDPISGINSKSLNIIIKNCCGHNTYIFIPEKVFDIIVQQKIRMLLPIIENYISKAAKLMMSLNQKVAEQVPLFTLYSDLKAAVIAQVENYCMINTNKVVEHCRNLINAETAFINKRHPEFISVFEQSMSKTSSCFNNTTSDNFESNAPVKSGSVVLSNSFSTSKVDYLNGLDLLNHEYSFPDFEDKSTCDSSGTEPSMACDFRSSDQEDANTALIKKLVVSYFNIIRKSVFDSTQKAIMHFLVFGTQKLIQNNLIISLQPSLADLMKLNPEPLLLKEELLLKKS